MIRVFKVDYVDGSEDKSITLSMTNTAMEEAHRLATRDKKTLLSAVQLIANEVINSDQVMGDEVQVTHVGDDKIQTGSTNIHRTKTSLAKRATVVFAPKADVEYFRQPIEGSKASRALNEFYDNWFRPFFRKLRELLAWATGTEFRPQKGDLEWEFDLLKDIHGMEHMQHVSLKEGANRSQKLLKMEQEKYSADNKMGIYRLKNFEKLCGKLSSVREASVFPTRRFLSYQNHVMSQIKFLKNGEDLLLPMGVFHEGKWCEFPLVVKKEGKNYTIRVLSSDATVEEFVVKPLGGREVKGLNEANLEGFLRAAHYVAVSKEIVQKEETFVDKATRKALEIFGPLLFWFTGEKGLESVEEKDSIPSKGAEALKNACTRLRNEKNIEVVEEVERGVGVTHQLFMFLKKGKDQEWETFQFAAQCYTFLKVMDRTKSWIESPSYRSDAEVVVRKLTAEISERLKIVKPGDQKEELTKLQAHLNELGERLATYRQGKLLTKSSKSAKGIKGEVSMPPISPVPKQIGTTKLSSTHISSEPFETFPEGAAITPKKVHEVLTSWNKKLKGLQSQREWQTLHQTSLLMAKQLPPKLWESLLNDQNLFDGEGGISYQLTELARYITFSLGKAHIEEGVLVDPHVVLALEHINYTMANAVMHYCGIRTDETEANQWDEFLVGLKGRHVRMSWGFLSERDVLTNRESTREDVEKIRDELTPLHSLAQKFMTLYDKFAVRGSVKPGTPEWNEYVKSMPVFTGDNYLEKEARRYIECLVKVSADEAELIKMKRSMDGLVDRQRDVILLFEKVEERLAFPPDFFEKVEKGLLYRDFCGYFFRSSVSAAHFTEPLDVEKVQLVAGPLSGGDKGHVAERWMERSREFNGKFFDEWRDYRDELNNARLVYLFKLFENQGVRVSQVTPQVSLSQTHKKQDIPERLREVAEMYQDITNKKGYVNPSFGRLREVLAFRNLAACNFSQVGKEIGKRNEDRNKKSALSKMSKLELSVGRYEGQFRVGIAPDAHLLSRDLYPEVKRNIGFNSFEPYIVRRYGDDYFAGSWRSEQSEFAEKLEMLKLKWDVLSRQYSSEEMQAIHAIYRAGRDHHTDTPSGLLRGQVALNTFANYAHFFDEPQFVSLFDEAVFSEVTKEVVRLNKTFSTMIKQYEKLAVEANKERAHGRAAILYRICGQMAQKMGISHDFDEKLRLVGKNATDPQMRSLIAKEYLYVIGSHIRSGEIKLIDDALLSKICNAKFTFREYPLGGKHFIEGQREAHEALFAYTLPLLEEKGESFLRKILKERFPGCEIKEVKFPQVRFTHKSQEIVADFATGVFSRNGAQIALLPDIVVRDQFAKKVIPSNDILYGSWHMVQAEKGQYRYTSTIDPTFTVVIDSTGNKDRVDLYRTLLVAGKRKQVQYVRFKAHEEYMRGVKRPSAKDFPLHISKLAGNVLFFAAPGDPKTLFLFKGEHYAGKIYLSSKGKGYKVKSFINENGAEFINISKDPKMCHQFTGLDLKDHIQVWGKGSRVDRVEYRHLRQVGGQVYAYQRRGNRYVLAGDENSVLQPKGEAPHVEKHRMNPKPILPKGFSHFDLIRSLGNAEQVVLAPRQFHSRAEWSEELLWDIRHDREPYEAGVVKEVFTFGVNKSQGYLESRSDVANLYLAYLFFSYRDFASALHYLELANGLNTNNGEAKEVYRWIAEWKDESPNGHAFKARVLIHQAMQEREREAGVGPGRSVLTDGRELFLENVTKEMGYYFAGVDPKSREPIDRSLILETHQLEVAYDLLQEANQREVTASSEARSPVGGEIELTVQNSKILADELYVWCEPNKSFSLDKLLFGSTEKSLLRYFYQIWNEINKLDVNTPEFSQLVYAIQSFSSDSTLARDALLIAVDKKIKGTPIIFTRPDFSERGYTNSGRQLDLAKVAVDSKKHSAATQKRAAVLKALAATLSVFSSAKVQWGQSGATTPAPVTHPTPEEILIARTRDVISESGERLESDVNTLEKKLVAQKQSSKEVQKKPKIPGANLGSEYSSLFATQSGESEGEKRLREVHEASTMRFLAENPPIKVKETTESLLGRQESLLLQEEGLKESVRECVEEIHTILKPRHLRAVYLGDELPLPISRLHGLWHQGEISEDALANLGFKVSEDDAKKLSQLVESQILLTIDANHAANQRVVVEQALESKGDPSTLEQVEKLLRQERPYDNTSTAYKELLLVEYYNGFMVRKEQMELVTEVLERKDKVLELPMGAGKTSVVLPVAAKARANGQNLVTLIVPEALFEINKQEMGKNANKLYGQKLMTFEFDPKCKDDVTYDTLLKQYRMLLETTTSQGFLLATKRSLLSYRNYFIDLLNKYEEEADPKVKKMAQVMAKTLNLLHTRGEAICDEIHEVLDVRKEVNKALLKQGGDVHLDKVHMDVGHDFFVRIINSNSLLKSALLTNSQEESLTPTVIDTCLREFARGYIDEWKADSSLEDYLMGAGGEEVKQWVDQLKNTNYEMWQKVVTVKSILSEGLFFTLQRTDGRQFGRWGSLTIPYERGKPRVGSEFDREVEKLIYTLQDYFIAGVNRGGFLALIDTFLMPALEEQRSELINKDKFVGLDETGAGKKFIEAMERLGIENPSLNSFNEGVDERVVSSYLATVNETAKSRIDFCAHAVLPQIQVIRSQIKANSRDLVSLFSHFGGTTGTNWAKHSYHEGIESDETSSIDGKTYALFTKMDKPKISIVNLSERGDLSSNLLNASKFGNPANVFIDAGGYLRGADAKSFVLQAMDLAQHFEGAIFPNEIGELVFIKQGTDQALPLSAAANTPKEKIMMLYPEPFCTGTDVKHHRLSEAILTVGSNTTTKDLFQAMWRMRQLGEKQSIHFLLSKEVQTGIVGNISREPTWQEIFNFCRKNQARLEGEYTYSGDTQKMVGGRVSVTFRQAVLSVKEGIMVGADELISTRTKEDFYNDASEVQDMADPIEKLEQLKRVTGSTIAIKDKGFYPPKVPGVATGSTVEVAVNQQKMQEQEQLVQLETTAETTLPFSKTRIHTYKYYTGGEKGKKEDFLKVTPGKFNQFSFSKHLLENFRDLRHPKCPPIQRLLVFEEPPNSGQWQNVVLSEEDNDTSIAEEYSNAYILLFSEKGEAWVSTTKTGEWDIKKVPKELITSIVQVKILCGMTRFTGVEKEALKEWLDTIGDTPLERKKVIEEALFPNGDDPYGAKRAWELKYENSILQKLTGI